MIRPNNNKIQQYIHNAKKMTFSFGNFNLMKALEEEVYYLRKYQKGEMDIDRLLEQLCGCPNDDLIDYESLCEHDDWNDDDRGCERCWIKALDLDK